jgi:signal transduction histidine kinase
MLAIVMGNLLDNACKFAAPESRIILKLNSAIQDGEAGWRWEFTNQVRPGDFLDAGRLFEKYYRSASARRVAGSGLGLFLVRGLTALLQGTINYSRQDDRVTFSLWLPEKLDRG